MGSKVISIQAGMPKTFEHLNEKRQAVETWTSGIFKQSAGQTVTVSKDGIEGDGQADLRYHGGPDRALLLFSKSHYPYFESFISKEIPNGGFGENFTLDFFEETDVAIGNTYRVGTAIIEISQPRLPCFKLGRRLDAPQIVDEVLDRRKGGVYARVLEEGTVSVTDELDLISCPHPNWTIHRAIDVYLSPETESKSELGSLSAISQLWREKCLS